VSWSSKRTVLLALGAVSLVVFAAGMLAAWGNRHNTICPDHKPPVQQRGGVLGQIVFRCHDGRLVTTPG
jgi:hypothetical protein